MRPAHLRWLTLGFLIVPAVSAGTLLDAAAWTAPNATPAWSRGLFDEAHVWSVRVAGPAAVEVRGNGTTGLQLHVFPDGPNALINTPNGLDLVPGSSKVRLLGPGDWLVAVDPSAPEDRVAVEFRGVPGRDRAQLLGPWTCPFDPRTGCIP